MSSPIKGSPYFDRYDSSKQYTQLLAVPGRVAQAREMTELQSTIKDIVKSIGDVLLSEGSVLEGGCQPTIHYDEEGKADSVTISAGKVYINGMVLPVAETTLTKEDGFTGSGTEIVGLKLKEEIIKEDMDPDLLDPASGYANHLRAGCHRLKSTVEIVINNPDAAPLVTIEDGVIAVEKYAPNYNALESTLARRTYNESGSYIAEGLKVRVGPHADNDYLNVIVGRGIAYVEGYELPFNNDITRKVRRAIDYAEIPVETDQFTYKASSSSYTLDEDGPFIESIVSVRGYKHQPIRSITAAHDSSGRQSISTEHRDIINLKVRQSSTELKLGEDYNVTSDPQSDGSILRIQWNESLLGETLTVEYDYRHDFTSSCKLVSIMNTSKNANEHHLVWEGTDRPTENTTFRVIYNQYFARKDLVYLDYTGELGIIEGIPADYGREVAPQSRDKSITLAIISHPPGGLVASDDPLLNIKVDNIGLTRFTMQDIQKIVNRLKIVEYDQAILNLENAARNHDTPNKKGIWTDPLTDYSRLDYNYERTISGTPYKFDATLDLVASICYLPTFTKVTEFYYNAEDTRYQSEKSPTVYKRAIALASTGNETNLISQPKATEVFYVNPYSKFPKLPEISLTPSADFWVDPEYITIPVSVKSSEVIKTSSRHTTTSQVLGGNFAPYEETKVTGYTDTEIGKSTNTEYSEYSLVSEEAATYIRPRTLRVAGRNFNANLRNIACYFDNIKCPFTRILRGEQGVDGTINPTADGTFYAEFLTPRDSRGNSIILSGIREVKLVAEGAESGVSLPGEVVKSASALYQSTGVKRTYTRTMTTLTTILLERVTNVTTTTYIDPVGQTFVLNRPSMIKGIDLYFGDAGGDSVTCEIREVVNGSITSNVYGHKTLDPEDISPSGQATRFDFEDPVFVEAMKEYAFVVRSASSDCSIWVAKLGKNNKIFKEGKIEDTTETVLSNPYLIGVMMSSSNNSTWTAHQDMDIKFDLWAEEYEDETTTYFHVASAESIDFSRLYLLGDSIVPTGTDIQWEYRVRTSRDTEFTNYKKVSPYTMELLGNLYEEVEMKLTLKNTSVNKNLSPLVVSDTLGLALSQYDTNGRYVSRYTSNLAQYTKIEVILEELLQEAGQSIKVSAVVQESDPDEDPIVIDLSAGGVNSSYGRWVERVYSAEVPKDKLPDGANELRVFINIQGSEISTPAFRRLRAIVS